MNPGSDQTFGPLAIHDKEAPFSEPWQAQVMALAFASSERGVFSPTQWSEALGAELRKASGEVGADERAAYYEAALRALESLLQSSGSLTEEAVLRRETEWRRAYLNTPHGKPVELRAGTLD